MDLSEENKLILGETSDVISWAGRRWIKLQSPGLGIWINLVQIPVQAVRTPIFIRFDLQILKIAKLTEPNQATGS